MIIDNHLPNSLKNMGVGAQNHLGGGGAKPILPEKLCNELLVSCLMQKLTHNFLCKYKQ